MITPGRGEVIVFADDAAFGTAGCGAAVFGTADCWTTEGAAAVTGTACTGAAGAFSISTLYGVPLTVTSAIFPDTELISTL